MDKLGYSPGSAIFRPIENGSAFDSYFEPSKRERILIHQDASVQDTISLIIDTIRTYSHEARKIARYLKAESTESTLENIWNFCFRYLKYQLDKGEEIRTPKGAWYYGNVLARRYPKEKRTDGKIHGIDCDCYTTFIGCILYELKISFLIKMTSYKKDDGSDTGYQHVYIIVPYRNKKGYITLDPVVNKYNYEKPENKSEIYNLHKQRIKKLDKMGQVYLLNGVQCSESNHLADILTGSDLEEGDLLTYLQKTRDIIQSNPKIVINQDRSKFLQMINYAIAAIGENKTEAALEHLEQLEGTMINTGSILGIDFENEDGLGKGFFSKIKNVVKKDDKKSASPALVTPVNINPAINANTGKEITKLPDTPPGLRPVIVSSNPVSKPINEPPLRPVMPVLNPVPVITKTNAPVVVPAKKEKGLKKLLKPLVNPKGNKPAVLKPASGVAVNIPVKVSDTKPVVLPTGCETTQTCPDQKWPENSTNKKKKTGILKKAGNKTKTAVKEKGKKVVNAVNKVNPVTVTVRNSLRFLFSVNLFGASSALAEGYLSESDAKNKGLQDWSKRKKLIDRIGEVFYKMGGNRSKLKDSILKGSRRKPLFNKNAQNPEKLDPQGFEILKAEPDDLDGLGRLGEIVTTSTAIAAGGSVFATFWKWIKESGILKRSATNIKNKLVEKISNNPVVETQAETDMSPDRNTLYERNETLLPADKTNRIVPQQQNSEGKTADMVKTDHTVSDTTGAIIEKYKIPIALGIAGVAYMAFKKKKKNKNLSGIKSTHRRKRKKKNRKVNLIKLK